MTKVKEQAIELLRSIPDEHIAYIIGILKELMDKIDNENNESNDERKRYSSMGILSKYANPDLVPNEKDAWGKAVREKYAVN